MKNLIFINGTMGVGKTTTCKNLLKLLPNCIFLDGDWCWYSNPWIINEEIKAMVLRNIGFLLDNYLNCSTYENIIFCWVMHEENIIHDVLSQIKNSNYNLYKFSLVSSKEALISRIQKDIDSGERDKESIECSLSRMTNYINMDTTKIDVSNITAAKAAKKIYNRMYPNT